MSSPGLHAVAALLGITDPNPSVGDLAAGVERLLLARRKDADTIARLLAEVDRVSGALTIARDERNAARHEAQRHRAERAGAVPTPSAWPGVEARTA